jgi:hypothetical protein
VSSRVERRNNSRGDETIFRFLSRTPETDDGYQTTQRKRRTAPSGTRGDRQMRTASFFVVVAFVLAVPSTAGSVDGNLPGIGTFAYGGTPATVIVAAR